MSPRLRESRIIEAVPCDECGALRGEPCRLHPTTLAKQVRPTGRLLVHGTRRRAWQVWRDAQPG